MKFATPRPYSDAENAARPIVEIASTVEPVQDGRIHVELINGPFLFEWGGSATGVLITDKSHVPGCDRVSVRRKPTRRGSFVSPGRGNFRRSRPVT